MLNEILAAIASGLTPLQLVARRHRERELLETTSAVNASPEAPTVEVLVTAPATISR